jgi:hypothetical protein
MEEDKFVFMIMCSVSTEEGETRNSPANNERPKQHGVKTVRGAGDAVHSLRTRLKPPFFQLRQTQEYSSSLKLNLAEMNASA